MKREREKRSKERQKTPANIQKRVEASLNKNNVFLFKKHTNKQCWNGELQLYEIQIVKQWCLVIVSKGTTGISIFWCLEKCLKSYHNDDVILLTGLAQLSKLKFLKDFHWGENHWIDDSSNSKSATNDGTNSGEEVIHRGSGFVVFHGNWIQVISKPNGRNDTTSVTKRDIAPEGVSVLISNQRRAV